MPTDKTGHFYYSRYPTIWGAHTQNLTLAEDGAYLRLCDHYMLYRAPLPIEDRALARIIGVGLDEWLSVKPSVIKYFKPTGLLLHHSFCDEMLEKDTCRIVKSKTNGKSGGRPSKGKTKEITHLVTEVKPLTEQNRTEHNELYTALEDGRTKFKTVYELGSRLYLNLATANTSVIHTWLNAGCDVEVDILPVIQRMSGRNIRSWSFFSAAIADAKATRETPMPEGHAAKTIRPRFLTSRELKDQKNDEVINQARERYGPKKAD